MNLYVNLDFEYEYLWGERAEVRAIRRQNERWSHVMRLMPEWHAAEPREKPGAGLWLPWGVTPSFRALNPEGDFPSCEVVRLVNSKVFSSRLEYELGVGLPGARIVDSMETLQQAVARIEGEGLVKNPWGVAGRERIVARAALDDDAERWARRQLDLVGELIVEPRISRTRDWSLQFELREEAQWLGSLELVTDAAGNHRGHRVGDQTPGDDILGPATDVASRVHREGYRGPLGIDAFEGSLGTERIDRPVCEINARMNFGRLAFELRDYVKQPFVWWHPPRSRPRAEVEPVRPGASAGTYRLPDFADPGGKSGSLVVIGDDDPWTAS